MSQPLPANREGKPWIRPTQRAAVIFPDFIGFPYEVFAEAPFDLPELAPEPGLCEVPITMSDDLSQQTLAPS